MQIKRATIIDDDPVALSYLKRILQKRGYEVQAHEDPAHSHIYKSTGCPCSQHPNCPDVIISDIDMPTINGIELLELNVKNGCRCRNFALISGKGMEQADLIRLAKYGTRHFAKPLNLDEFYAWLDRVEQGTI